MGGGEGGKLEGRGSREMGGGGGEREQREEKTERTEESMGIQ